MRLIRLKEVMNISGLGRSSIYKFMDDGTFPQSISLGERAVSWQESEVEEWIQDKVERRNKVSNRLVKGSTEMEISEVDVIKFIKNKFHNLNLSDAVTWLIGFMK